MTTRSNIVKILVPMLCILGSKSYADGFEFNSPYIGASVGKSIMRFAKGKDGVDNYGDSFFSKKPDPTNFTVMAGVKISDYFGFEAGYQHNFSKRKDRTLNQDDFLPGDNQKLMDDPYLLRTNNSIKSNNIYAGLFIEHNIFNLNKTKFKCLIGLSNSKITATNKEIEESVNNGANWDQINLLYTFKSRKNIPTIKLQIAHSITEHFVFTLATQWFNYPSLKKIKSKEDPNSAKTLKFKNTYNLQLGFNYLL